MLSPPPLVPGIICIVAVLLSDVVLPKYPGIAAWDAADSASPAMTIAENALFLSSASNPLFPASPAGISRCTGDSVGSTVDDGITDSQKRGSIMLP